MHLSIIRKMTSFFSFSFIGQDFHTKTKDNTDDFVCVYKLREIEDGKIGAFEN